VNREASGESEIPRPQTAPPVAQRAKRTSPRQFMREVRSEMRKVAWPSRRELLSYSVVVLVSVTIMTLFITGLDQLFGFVILRVFGS
jgi:preprotein translocase subunit SecE